MDQIYKTYIEKIKQREKKKQTKKEHNTKVQYNNIKHITYI